MYPTPEESRRLIKDAILSPETDEQEINIRLWCRFVYNTVQWSDGQRVVRSRSAVGTVVLRLSIGVETSVAYWSILAISMCDGDLDLQRTIC